MKTHMLFMVLLMCLTGFGAAKNSATLSQYIDTALQSNTEILSAQLAVEAAQQDGRMNSAFPDPAFMIEGRSIPLDVSRFGDTRELMFMLEQMFPAPGALNRLEQRGDLAADIEAEMLRAVQNDITKHVKQTWYQLSYLDAALKTNQRHIDLMNDFEQIAESKYIVGQTGQQDLYQIKIEKAQLKSEQASLKEKRDSMAAEFNRLLKRDLFLPVYTDSLTWPVTMVSSTFPDSLLDENNPLLAAAHIRIASRENDVELARANKRPAFKVMGGYMAMNNADDALMGRVGLTLPFMPWSSKDTRAAVEKSRVIKNKAEVDYQTLKDRLAVQLTESTNSLQALEEQIDLYQYQIVPAAAHTVSLSRVGYEAGSIDFLSLIQYAREQLRHELRRDELISQYWQKTAQLEFIVGTDLEVLK